jgi:succinate dehydrogenase flavin-adding protein (antitoxin of CptAB toxin-antitoxin module)
VGTAARAMSMLVGAFADQCLREFGAEELCQFERLLEDDDPIL